MEIKKRTNFSQKRENFKKRLSENVRSKHPKSIKTLMKEADYSPSYSEHPSKVLSDPDVQVIAEKILPTEYLLKKNRELLEIKELKQLHFDVNISDCEIEEIIKEAGCNLLNIKTVTVEYTTKKGEVKSFDKKEVFYTAPNALAQDRALDKAYKIKKYYEPKDTGKQPDDFSKYSPEEIREVFAQLVLRIGTYIPRGSR